MLACIYKRPFKWKSPPKENFSFKYKVKKSNMQRFKKYISLKKYRDWLPYKKQIQKNIFFCS